MTRRSQALREQVRLGQGDLLDSSNGPLWFRGFVRPHGSGLEEHVACEEVRAVAAAVGAERMAVGHNIVPWVTTRCGGALQLLDVGMSYAYGGQPAAWKCTLEGAGEPVIRALYRDEPPSEPPDLCARCSQLAWSERWSEAAEDCRQYC